MLKCDLMFLFLCAEIDGSEEGVRRYNPEHGEGSGGEDHGFGAKSHSVSARAGRGEGAGASDAPSAQTNVGC